jgi:hypothetical protein
MSVPPHARWNVTDETKHARAALKDTQVGIGKALNKVIAEWEDENERPLRVLKGNIDYNEMVAGKPKMKKADLKIYSNFTRSLDQAHARRKK